MQSIDDLANVITEMDPAEQQTLWDKVAQLNFRKGLHDLAEKYRARLAREDQLNSPQLSRYGSNFIASAKRSPIMTTPPERWLLDTNVWIFGLRRDTSFPACGHMLDRIGLFSVLIPLQVLKELNLL
jgi:hypothetical protein